MNSITLTIDPREKDLGGFTVRRLLPFARRRMVGPFVFFDHMGPAHFNEGQGIDVRPHPHIGLATVTYLLAGTLHHRDTLGSDQAIQPGAVNWMTAGQGIAHSERTSPPTREHPHALHGLQSWVALPREAEEVQPSFHHHPAPHLPEASGQGWRLRLICGRSHGEESPVTLYSPTFYADVHLDAQAIFDFPATYRERALYVVEGQVRIGGVTIDAGHMPVFEPEGELRLEALTPSRIMILGGDPLSEPRFIWWNFVSSSQERIEQAKADWANGVFGKVPGDEHEFIPLPESI